MKKILQLFVCTLIALPCAAQEKILSRLTERRLIEPVRLTAIWHNRESGIGITPPSLFPAVLSSEFRQDLRFNESNRLEAKFNHLPALDLVRRVSITLEIALRARRELLPGLQVALHTNDTDYRYVGDCAQDGQMISCRSNERMIGEVSYQNVNGQIVPLCGWSLNNQFTLSLVRTNEAGGIEPIKELARFDTNFVCDAGWLP